MIDFLKSEIIIYIAIGIEVSQYDPVHFFYLVFPFIKN